MPVELLLLVLAWAAIVSLIVALPWAVIRLAVGVIEADGSKRGAEHEHAQPHQPPDEPMDTELPHEPDDAGESGDAVPPPARPDANADGADK